MIKTKKQSLIIIGAFALVMLLGTVTYAFFNYTRTGSSNVIKTGRISFNSSQGTAINLTNLFPIDVSEGIPNDVTKVGTVTINITGDTTYGEGIEYLVSAVNVTNTAGSGQNAKSLPISIDVAVESNSNNDPATTLGTADANYFTNRGSNASIYKVLASDVIENNEQLVVGYIAPGSTGVDGNIVIRAYLDASKIAISDTYPEGDVTHTEGEEPNQTIVTDYTNGTTSTWVGDRTVFTTAEWNSLQTNGVSFQVKVEANEGIWIEEMLSRNDMVNFNIYNSEIIPTSVRSTITEVNFIRMSEDLINQHTNLIDLSNSNGEGVVKAWIDNAVLYIASPGITYFPTSCERLLSEYTNVTTINFNNVNTSEVTTMSGMFAMDSLLTSIDLSNLGSDSLTSVMGIFYNCASLVDINMSNFNFGLIDSIGGGFVNRLANLESLDLSNAKMTNVTTMISAFADLPKLVTLDLSNVETSTISDAMNMFEGDSLLTSVDISSITFNTSVSIEEMFKNDYELETIYASNDWNTRIIINTLRIFDGCSSLVGRSPNTSYSYNNSNSDVLMAKVATDSVEGYFTDISLKPTN